jgi:hypothetical protein
MTRRHYYDLARKRSRNGGLWMFGAFILSIIVGFIRASLEPGFSYIQPMVATTLILIVVFVGPIWWLLSCQWIRNPTIRLTVQALLAAGIILWLEFYLLSSLKN